MSNKTTIIAALEKEQMTKEIPDFSPGDTVVVQVKVKEGTRERLQAFEGVVLAKKNRQLNSAFTVRKISNGIGVERTFQTYSPLVIALKLSVAVQFVAPSFTTCVSVQVDLRVLKKSSINKNWFQTSICCAEKGGSERAAFFNARNTLKSIRQ